MDHLRPGDRAAHNKVQLDHYRIAASQNPRLQPADTPYVNRHVDRMVEFGRLQPGERILDVGCGMGKFTVPLLRRGLSVEGLDLSPDLLQVFRSGLEPEERVALHCVDLLDVPEDLVGRYDVVIGFFVLHHLVDLQASFEAIRRLLRPGGRVAFVEPNGFNPLYYLQITLTPGMSWRSDRGVARMTRGRLVSALTAAGFDQIHVDRSGALPPALLNRRWGTELEDLLDRTGLLGPAAAFQLIRGVVPPI